MALFEELSQAFSLVEVARAGLLNNSECLFWRVSLLRF